jgi:recombination protein RecA
LEIIQKSGSWYNYGKDKIGQGREAAKQFLKDNPKISAEIDKKLKDYYFGNHEQPKKPS